MVPCMVYKCWCTCFDKNLTLYNRFLHILWSNGLASMCILHIHDLPFPFCVFFLLAMQFTKKLRKFLKLLQISRKKSSIVFIEKNLHISEPVQFESVLFEGQQYFIGSTISSIIRCNIILISFYSVQWLSHVRLFVTPWTAARQASLSITNSWSLISWNS